MKDYVITSSTLAILPYGRKSSIVYDANNSYIISRKPNAIINSNCIYHGSTYDGRLLGTKKLTGYTYKAPIIVDESNSIIFFPTSSPRLSSCCWVNLFNISNNYYDDTIDKSYIRFNNNREICLPVSKNILDNQILRAYKLAFKISKNEKNHLNY